jgi:hypothetical protein
MHILIGFVWPFYSTNTCENIMLYIINLYNFCQLKEGRKEGERKGRREEENEGGKKRISGHQRPYASTSPLMSKNQS